MCTSADKTRARERCSHYELDAREYMSQADRPKPYQPRGALDGNVCDSRMAKAMSFELRWGCSCGKPFDKRRFCNEHREWAYLEPYLDDRPSQPWTVFRASAGGKESAAKRARKTRKSTV
jgi:hypothetical protein